MGRKGFVAAQRVFGIYFGAGNMAVISVASGAGQSLVFTVTGTWTTAYADAFASYASTVGTWTSLDAPTSDVARSNEPAALGTNTLYTFDQIGGSALAVGGYLLDSAAGASTIYGSGAGDTVLFAGVNQAGLYVDNGGSNQIIFVSGDNTYDGVNATGADTIVAGSGFDTINTGEAGTATVDSGTGNADITLYDTTAGSTFNDLVYLDDGMSTVYADGMFDGVVANAAGQTLIGGTVAGGQDAFVLNTAELASTVSAGDMVVAGAATTTVLDGTSNNTIFGGSGVLFYSEGASVTSAYIVGGSGGEYIFGAAGSTLAIDALAANTAPNELVAGAGSESMYGGYSTGNLLFFCGVASDSTSAGTYNETLTGGSGNDTFVTGSGFESLTGGAGDNLFVIDASSVGGANITIADFGASAGNLYEFSGFTGDPIVSETEGSAGVTLTLSDNTTVTFLGETTAGLNGHLV